MRTEQRIIREYTEADIRKMFKIPKNESIKNLSMNIHFNRDDTFDLETIRGD